MLPAAARSASVYTIQFSTSPNRVSPVSLAGKSVAGNIYVFTKPDSGVTQVRFYIDNPSMSGAPLLTERKVPYDLRGTNADGTAKPLDTRTLTSGQHTITAAVDKSAGGTDVLNANFTVANSYSIQFSTSPNRVSPVSLAGKSVAGNIYVFTKPDSGVTQVRFYIDNPSMSGAPLLTERKVPYDLRGTNADGTARPLDTTTLTSGQHTITAAVDKSAGGTDVLHATVFVWRSVAAAPLARFEARGDIAGGKLVVFGGFIGTKCCSATARADVYDPATNTWTQISDMPETLTHSAVAVDGDTIYLVGGYVGNGAATTSVLKYDLGTNTWSSGPSLPVPRGAGAAALLGRNLHFFGGIDRGYLGEADRGDHFVLSLDGGTEWETLAPMPNPRNHLAGASVGGKAYAIGGQHIYDENNGNDSEVDAYDPATGEWSRVASLPAARGHIGATVLDGHVLAIGGTLAGNVRSTDVTAYDPASDTWLKLPSLPAARKSPVVGVVNDLLIVSTGDGTERATSTTWIGDVSSVGWP